MEICEHAWYDSRMEGMKKEIQSVNPWTQTEGVMQSTTVNRVIRIRGIRTVQVRARPRQRRPISGMRRRALAEELKITMSNSQMCVFVFLGP